MGNSLKRVARSQRGNSLLGNSLKLSRKLGNSLLANGAVVSAIAWLSSLV